MRNYIIAGVAVAVAVFTAYGTVLVGLDNRVFEAQAQMVTQEQFRFELIQSNDRVNDRLDSIERLIFLLMEHQANASIQ